jgi:hypothetical protein
MSRPQDQDDELRQRLRQLRVDPPAADFHARLHQRLAEAGPPAAPPWWQRLPEIWRSPRVLWPAAGLAAGVMVFLALTLMHGALPSAPPSADGLAAVEVPATKVAIVRVDLNTDVAVQSADIRVSLPDGLVFWSEGHALAQRTFEWSQPLDAGGNELPIPVRGQRPGRYLVKVSARIGNAWIEHDVSLEVIDG